MTNSFCVNMHKLLWMKSIYFMFPTLSLCSMSSHSWTAAMSLSDARCDDDVFRLKISSVTYARLHSEGKWSSTTNSQKSENRCWQLDLHLISFSRFLSSSSLANSGSRYIFTCWAHADADSSLARKLMSRHLDDTLGWGGKMKVWRNWHFLFYFCKISSVCVIDWNAKAELKNLWWQLGSFFFLSFFGRNAGDLLH